MAGFAPTWERMVVRGSLEERSFCAFLLDAAGVASIDRVALDWPRDVRRSFELIRGPPRPDPDALADPDVDLRTLSSPAAMIARLQVPTCPACGRARPVEE